MTSKMLVAGLLLVAFLVSNTLSYSYEGDGTIEEPSSVDVSADAKVLRAAVKGWGTDEADLIDVLTHRSYNTRQRIFQAYRSIYDRDLWEDIKSDTSGDFRLALKALVLTSARFLAEEIRSAVHGWGTNEDELILCLMLVVNDHQLLNAVRNEYEYIYDQDLEERIEDETGGEFETFLVEILNRPEFNESAPIDKDLMESDLADLETFMFSSPVQLTEVVKLVTGRSLNHLAALQENYYQVKNEELYSRLEQISSHHTRDALVSFMSVASSFHRYLAYELFASMDGSGTDEDSLTSIIVSRADKDLQTVKEVFEEMTGRELKDMVHSDTSGDYRKTLLSIIN